MLVSGHEKCIFKEMWCMQNFLLWHSTLVGGVAFFKPPPRNISAGLINRETRTQGRRVVGMCLKEVQVY